MKTELTKIEKMLLDLLRVALTEHTQRAASPTLSLFEEVDETAWRQCFGLAKKHGVMALAWDGVQHLPQQLFPPKSVKINWALQVADYETKYERYVKTLVQLTEFYAKHGIGLVQMKGVGLSSYYPRPSHREGGDIDIYTYSLDHSVMSDAEANHLADQLMMDQGIEVETEHPKHSVFFYHGVPIENHHFFLNEKEIPYAKAMGEYLHRVCEPRKVALLDGAYEVNIPSPAFNQVFVPFHAMQHWSAGLCLHHLCDCAVIAQKQGLVVTSEAIDPHFKRALAVFAEFARRFLGVGEAGEYSEELFEMVMADVFRNAFNVQGDHLQKIAGWRVFLFKLTRFCRRVKVRRKVIGESIPRAIWQSIIMHLKKPATIFHFS